MRYDELYFNNNNINIRKGGGGVFIINISVYNRIDKEPLSNLVNLIQG
uniref:Uncharacterized protein n=1 Tax=Lepeophtheirus salmonis TaxID=72036 RepID=A0A0K2VHW6_LEPSM